MQEFSQEFSNSILAARKEVAASGNGFARQAEQTINLAVGTVLGTERRFLQRMEGQSAEAMEFVGRAREKSYALVLTTKGVSEATAATVVAEAMAHATKPD